jgi:tetratricopeptide (TPR) repeat protein
VECPSDDDLSSYLAGRIAAIDAASIASHVPACRMCSALVDVLATRAPAEAPTLPAASTHVEPRAGDTVGTYVLQRRIGAGGMGVVWAAYDPDLDREVAIKLVRDAGLRVRFDREVRITAKLQHPSIVGIVEAGAHTTGEPYYVMKLVGGESLDKLIAVRSTPAERLGLLPSVIAVVDALAYAHRAGVIHRDLKPENVLVGEFGETIVIDWGVAKSLADPRTDTDDSSRSPATNETEAGSVIGTPAYMPREQALGQAVDARADVYALGAMLYFLLSGQRPYADTASNAILEAVLAHPPAPLSTPGIPADLTTIVAKAMARDAADRYPTAIELADDLKRFQTGQLVASHRYSIGELVRRWFARHRTAVAVAGVALIVLTVLAIGSVRRILDEKHRASDEQHHAEQQRAEVEKLLIFMLGDLREQLKPIGKIELLEKVALQAKTYFERSDASSGTDPHLRMKALLAVGDVLSAKGNTATALAEDRAAQVIARIHAAISPGDLTWRRDLAETDTKVAAALIAQGDLPGALTAYREALALTSQVAHDDPTDTHQRDVSVNHDNVGYVLLLQGDSAGALAEFRAGIAIASAQVARYPQDAPRLRDLAVSHSKIGEVLAARGDIAGALVELHAALDIASRLVSADPADVGHKRDLAVFHGELARMVLATGDAATALVEHRSALALFRQLADHDPDDTNAKRDLANSLSYVASLIEDSDMHGALALCREARVIRAALVARDPKNSQWQSDLLASAQQIANTLLAAHDLAAAIVEARTSIEIGELLVARDPTNSQWQQNLEYCHAAAADILAAQARRDAAIAEQRAGLVIAERLVAADSSRSEWQRDLSERHEGIGNLLAPVDAKQAAVEYHASLEIAQHLAIKEPKNPEWSQLVTALRGKLAVGRHGG